MLRLVAIFSFVSLSLVWAEDSTTMAQLKADDGENKFCPEGWIDSPTTGTCISFFENYVNWYEARASCKEYEADLVKIKDVNMTELIAKYLPVDMIYPWFIGLHDDQTEGVWTWLDEPAGSDLGYTNWHDGQPNNQMTNMDKAFDRIGEDCAEVGWFSLTEWTDTVCTDGAYYICEGPP